MSRIYLKINDANQESKEVTKKLNMDECIFRVHNIETMKENVTYSFSKIINKTYKAGKIDSEEEINTICLSLVGYDIKDREYSLSFEIKSDLKALNKLDNKIVDITSLVVEGENIYKTPDKNYNFFEMEVSTNSNLDIEKNLSYLYVLKLKENIFRFKMVVPKENLFASFIVDFN